MFCPISSYYQLTINCQLVKSRKTPPAALPTASRVSDLSASGTGWRAVKRVAIVGLLAFLRSLLADSLRRFTTTLRFFRCRLFSGQGFIQPVKIFACDLLRISQDQLGLLF